MEEKILIGGSGGQGVLTLGNFLARVAIKEKKNVTWLPSYGAEKKGGFSFCNIVISDEEIYCPIVESPDTLILFDQRALDTFFSTVNENTLVIANSSMIKDFDALPGKATRIPATAIANNLVFSQATNTVLAGVYFMLKTILKAEDAFNVLKNMLVKKSGEIIDKNVTAFQQGIEFARSLTQNMES